MVPALSRLFLDGACSNRTIDVDGIRTGPYFLDRHLHIVSVQEDRSVLVSRGATDLGEFRRRFCATSAYSSRQSAESLSINWRFSITPLSSKVPRRFFTCPIRLALLAAEGPLLVGAGDTTSHQYPHFESVRRPQKRCGLRYPVSMLASLVETSAWCTDPFYRNLMSSPPAGTCSPRGPREGAEGAWLPHRRLINVLNITPRTRNPWRNKVPREPIRTSQSRLPHCIIGLSDVTSAPFREDWAVIVPKTGGVRRIFKAKAAAAPTVVELRSPWSGYFRMVRFAK